ncbi:MAG TPA: efflux RND transporter periplasmic adaptor subunit [Sphingobium sp.]|uniref:efflux RND transporter periplasmic adaptor subunit n=1 Tax=Sphingobium sp. TaxID=1912891 RepID=UPI002ED48BD7
MTTQITRTQGLILLLILMAIGAAILLWGNADKPVAADKSDHSAAAPGTVRYGANAPQLAMIQTGKAEMRALPLTEMLGARIVYDENATARIGVGFSGRLLRVDVAPGDPVRAGQVLAVIDSPDFGTARADLDKARADEERKRLDLARLSGLGSGEGISARDVEAARADYAAAHAESARAVDRLRNLNPTGLKVGGQQVRLTSPISGVLTERNANSAMEVVPDANAPLFVVTDPRRLWLLIDVPERLLGRVSAGSEVEVESDAFPDRHVRARIERIGAVVDAQSRRVTARAVVQDGAGLLPEMFVRARILQPGRNAVRVPTAAIVNSGTNSYVFVETAPGNFARRKVTLLTRESDFSSIATGLSGGETIVTKGALLLDGELTSGANDAS